MVKCFLTALIFSLCTPFGPATAQDASDEPQVRIEVDQAATNVLREWVADFDDNVFALRVESPNLEFAFRVNGKVVGEWQGERFLSDGYSNDEYRNTRYDFNVTVIFDRKENNAGKTTVCASSRVRINTRKHLTVYPESVKAQLTAQKPKQGVLFFDSEWFNKKKPWTTPFPKRSDDDFITIWRVKLENHVDRKIVETADSPTIELVARPVR